MRYVFAGSAIVVVAIIGWWFVAPSTEVPEVQTPIVNETAQLPTEPTALTATPKQQEAPKGVTMTEVATHNSEASCWTVVNGNVYDVTSFIDKHPGGRRNVLKLCGADGTAEFTGQHGGQSQPESTLAGFKMGALAQ